MFFNTFSAAIGGIDGFLVQVEVDVSDGLPEFSLVGYLASEVKEARERVRISLKNSGYKIPPKRITINLSPADVRKEGTAFDLSIALAILVILGYIPEDNLKQTLIIGELSLDGHINKVNGVLPIVDMASRKGFTRCILPLENAKEGAVINNIDVLGVSTLTQVVEYLNEQTIIEAEYVDTNRIFQKNDQDNTMDFRDIQGQYLAKRGVEIAVAGMHNILLVGTPGAGKSMIAKRIPTIMPSLTLEESMEISKVYSVSGLLNQEEYLVLNRPFRSPHHSITGAALIGGGRKGIPGEVSLASGGVLFLDELPEFPRNVTELLRQPLEDKYINIARLSGNYRYPSNCMLVASMNPCKCGYYPDRNRCNCSENQVRKYLGRLSGPLLDRIDIIIEMSPVSYHDLERERHGETSGEIRSRIEGARNIQKNRYKKEPFFFNGELTPSLIQAYCKLGKKESELLEKAFYQLQLSARGYHRLIKVARTIADLQGEESIQCSHIIEAIGYRSNNEGVNIVG